MNDLARKQSAFIASMVASGKGWSDLNTAERAEAARLGFCRRLPKLAAPRPMPERVTYNTMERAWW